VFDFDHGTFFRIAALYTQEIKSAMFKNLFIMVIFSFTPLFKILRYPAVIADHAIMFTEFLWEIRRPLTIAGYFIEIAIRPKHLETIY
jgi:hypothetical protein